MSRKDFKEEDVVFVSGPRIYDKLVSCLSTAMPKLIWILDEKN